MGNEVNDVNVSDDQSPVSNMSTMASAKPMRKQLIREQALLPHKRVLESQSSVDSVSSVTSVDSITSESAGEDLHSEDVASTNRGVNSGRRSSIGVGSMTEGMSNMGLSSLELKARRSRNKVAANRYRQKKKQQTENLISSLRCQVADLEAEVQRLRGFLQQQTHVAAVPDQGSCVHPSALASQSPAGLAYTPFVSNGAAWYPQMATQHAHQATPGPTVQQPYPLTRATVMGGQRMLVDTRHESIVDANQAFHTTPGVHHMHTNHPNVSAAMAAVGASMHPQPQSHVHGTVVANMPHTHMMTLSQPQLPQ